MSRDSETANFYQQHKDDPNVWGDADNQVPAHSRKGLEATITVRFSSEEAALIRGLAKRDNLTASEVVRAAVKNYLRPHFHITAGTTNLVEYMQESTKVRACELLEFGASFKPFIVSATGRRP